MKGLSGNRASVPVPIQQHVRSVSRTIGRLSSGARMLPSFLIVGAQRSGTTSLYKALSQHPDVLQAVLHKGVHYFDTAYERDMSWYQGHFPLLYSARRAQRSAGSPVITGESSPYYMFHPLAAQRIAAALPDVKLLALLRDPVERAYSAHSHESARGFETESFERAIELEPARLAGEAERLADPGYYSHHHQHNAYLARGQYIGQLEALERVVGRGRIHVVDSAEFFAEPEPVYRDVLGFLGLPAWSETEFERHNARSRVTMPEDLRQRLTEHFRPYDERLARWLGREPSWRR